MPRAYTEQECWERASLRVVHHMRGLWEERKSSDTRLLEAFFLPDKFTLAGHSRKFTGVGRREHVVPRRVIVEECHGMLNMPEVSDARIARFIRDHVRIVMITHAESDHLDRKAGLGLRQSMPEGWKFGHDIYARLKLAGIEWIPLRDRPVD